MWSRSPFWVSNMVSYPHGRLFISNVFAFKSTPHIFPPNLKHIMSGPWPGHGTIVTMAASVWQLQISICGIHEVSFSSVAIVCSSPFLNVVVLQCISRFYYIVPAPMFLGRPGVVFQVCPWPLRCSDIFQAPSVPLALWVFGLYFVRRWGYGLFQVWLMSNRDQKFGTMYGAA